MFKKQFNLELQQLSSSQSYNVTEGLTESRESSESKRLFRKSRLDSQAARR